MRQMCHDLHSLGFTLSTFKWKCLITLHQLFYLTSSKNEIMHYVWLKILYNTIETQYFSETNLFRNFQRGLL